MVVMMVRVFVIVISILLNLSACSGGCLDIDEIEKELHSKLNIGDSREMVDASLKDTGVQFTYDKFQNRYNAAITEGCSKYEAIIVLIVFDDSNKLSEIKVFKEYTWW